MTIQNKHWISDAVACLEECLSPVPHEVNELDWKSQISEKSERLTEHLIAFANHPSGGCLVFGITSGAEQMPPIDQASVEKIVNTLANLGRDAVIPPLALDHAVVELRGANILLVNIPEQSVKPAHRRGKSLDVTWIRSGGTTRSASRQEVGSLMLNSASPRWEALRASSLLSLDAAAQVLDLDTISKLLQRPLPKEDDALAHWLVEEGLAVREGRGYYITNFGAVAAAHKLEHFPGLERKRLRVIRYRGLNKVDTIDEVPGQRGYASGFEGLIGYLKRVLPHSEVIGQSLRAQVAVFPEIALRELIANALIHQDFSITGTGLMVEIFDDRVEFTNPGNLLPGKRPDRLIGTTPESRNETLASSFRRYRICEERGTGFQKVVQSAELFGLPPISFAQSEKSFRVTLYAPRKFSEMSQGERIEAAYQHAVLQYLSSQTLTNTTLRHRFKLHEKQRNQVSNLIGEAVSAGRIKRKDSGSGNKFAEYLPYWA